MMQTHSNFSAILTAGVAACALSLATSAVAHDRDDDHEAGPAATRTLDLKDFERLDISGVYDLDVEVGKAFSITLSGSERDLDKTDITVANGALKMAMKKTKRWGGNNHHDTITARVTLPVLKAVNVSGVVDGEIEGVDSEAFKITVSGVGDIDIAGKCGALDARVSGVGDLEAENLECRDVTVRVTGVGDASVYASKSVDASASGVGDIDVFGKPSEVSERGGMFSEVTIR